MTAFLAIDGLRKSYREGERSRLVLDGFSAELAGGERVALVGRSGAGKSTVLNLVSGMDHADAGRVVVGETVVTALDEQARTRFRRRAIGFVFQFFNLIPTLTVRENLELPLELTGALDAEGRRRAAALLERVGLEERAGSFPEHLSGGEQQRVAIARALIHRPALLLADEPTGTLDADTGAEVLALMDELVRDAGMTVLMVTHSDEVAATCDRVIRVRSGRAA